MSLFIASLAFTPGAAAHELSRLGIVTGTLLSGIAGYLVLRRALRKA